MGKESQIAQLDLSPLAQQKLEELVSLLSDEGFGVEGPARDTDFATIEEYGHQAGRRVAQAIDEQLTRRHARHFQQAERCPTCGLAGNTAKSSKERPFQTRDGTVTLSEPAAHCPNCERSFFPSADGTQD